MRDLPMQKYVRDPLVLLHHAGKRQSVASLKVGKALEARYKQACLWSPRLYVCIGSCIYIYNGTV